MGRGSPLLGKNIWGPKEEGRLVGAMGKRRMKMKMKGVGSRA